MQMRMNTVRVRRNDIALTTITCWASVIFFFFFLRLGIPCFFSSKFHLMMNSCGVTGGTKKKKTKPSRAADLRVDTYYTGTRVSGAIRKDARTSV